MIPLIAAVGDVEPHWKHEDDSPAGRMLDSLPMCFSSGIRRYSTEARSCAL